MKKLVMVLGLMGLLVGCADESHFAKVEAKDGTSIKGDKGDTGAAGKDGKDGQSIKGDKGDTGATGAAGKDGKDGVGIKGDKGDKGDSIKGDKGDTGATGAAGKDGKDGKDAAPIPGLTCDVHNLPSWDNNTSLPEAFVGNVTVGAFVMASLNVGDSPSANGFPGMPAAIRNIVGDEGYALDCAGYINVATSGFYKIKLFSDDGSELRINDQLVIDNQGLHSPQTKSATVRLNKGQNRINVVYYQGPHSQVALELKWSGPNLVEQVIPAANYTH